MKCCKNFIDLKDVITVELDLSTVCDGKCPLCFRNMLSFPEKYKHQFFRVFNDIIAQLDAFANLKTLQICGQMSEPTLYPRLLDLIKYAKSRKLQVILYTNGNSQTDSFYSSVANCLDINDKVIFTICGLDEMTHQHYRKNICLSNVLSHAKALRDIIPIDNAKCIMFSYNFKQLNSSEFLQFIKQFSSYDIISTSYDDMQLFNKNYIVDDFQPIRCILKKYKLVEALAKLNGKMCCDSLNSKSVHIDPYGKIYPCYLFLQHNFDVDFNMNYDKILSRNYDSCKFCQEQCLKKINFCDIK